MKLSLVLSGVLSALALPIVAASQYVPTAFDDSMAQYILTPKAPQTPRINCPKIFGVRPGSPILFYVATTGQRPLSFSAENLPAGVKLDSKTGILSGSLTKRGTYNITLHAGNSLGKDSRDFRLVVGDEMVLTPPMGWNSWNCWGNTVSQEKVLSSACAMKEKGLADYGWSYINVDDGWQGKRGGKNNAIQSNIKFPDMEKMVDKIHSMGLKAGIYCGPWVGTYAGHIGSQSDNADGTYDWIKKGQHNENYKFVLPGDPEGKKIRKVNYYHGRYSFASQDAQQWADWGFDYLKYDWNPNDYYYTREMHDALQKVSRDIVLSLSNTAPYADAPVWLRYSQCWRTTGDIRDTWNSIYQIGFKGQDRWAAFNRPGHWADADMLVVGKVGWGNPHDSRLTADEQYTHISLWALLASPMLIGCDMARMNDFTVSLLCNNEVNDVNQDPLGIQAYRFYGDSTYATYVKPLEDGSMAVGLFNLSSKAKSIGFIPKSFGFRDNQKIRDLWRQQDVAEIPADKRYETTVAAHGVALVKIYPGNTRERTYGEPRTEFLIK